MVPRYGGLLLLLLSLLLFSPEANATPLSWTFENQPLPCSSGGDRVCRMASLGHGRALLLDGTVQSPLRRTWIFNASAGQAGLWNMAIDTTGEITPIRQRFAMASFGVGAACMFGGSNVSNQDQYFGDTWIYEEDIKAKTKQWIPDTVSTVKPGARELATMASLAKGTVIMFGGANYSVFLGDTWIYQQNKGWKLVDSGAKNSPSPRTNAAMSSFGSGKVILFGGFDGLDLDIVGDTWIYNSANGWTDVTPITSPEGRIWHSLATLTKDAKPVAVLFGGRTRTGEVKDTTWVYQANEKWTKGPAPVNPSPRNAASICAITESTILMHGGTHLAIKDMSSYTYQLERNWTSINAFSIPQPRQRHAIALLGNKTAILVGGQSYQRNTRMGETWLYETTPGWRSSPVQTPYEVSSIYWHSMASLGSSRVLLFGGMTQKNLPSNTTWIYNRVSGWHQKTCSVAPTPRYDHTAVAVTSTKVLIFGGFDPQHSDYPLNDIWEYQVGKHECWNEVRPPINPPGRQGHAMSPLGNGEALLFGGNPQGEVDLLSD